MTNRTAVEQAYLELAEAGITDLYVQKMAPPDRSSVPTVWRLVSDPSFGAVVSFGLGGMATDLLDDFSYQAVPLTDRDAADLVSRPRAAALLSGYRGTEPVNLDALHDLALRLSRLADEVPEVIALELNPVLVGSAGCCVTGATGRVGSAGRRVDLRRRL